MSDDGFLPEDHRPGYETLGPAYFAARRFAEALFAGAEPEPFKDALKKAVDALQYGYREPGIYVTSDHFVEIEMKAMNSASVRLSKQGEELFEKLKEQKK